MTLPCAETQAKHSTYAKWLLVGLDTTYAKVPAQMVFPQDITSRTQSLCTVQDNCRCYMSKTEVAEQGESLECNKMRFLPYLALLKWPCKLQLQPGDNFAITEFPCRTVEKKNKRCLHCRLATQSLRYSEDRKQKTESVFGDCLFLSTQPFWGKY